LEKKRLTYALRPTQSRGLISHFLILIIRLGKTATLSLECQDQGNYWLSPILTAKTALELSVPEEPLARKRGFMKKEVNELEDELRPEYNFSEMAGGVRGKYVERYRAGTNLVLLDPDVAQAFPTDASVNEALRLLIQIAHRQQPNVPVEAD
jgi:hypothetical protein